MKKTKRRSLQDQGRDPSLGASQTHRPRRWEAAVPAAHKAEARSLTPAPATLAAEAAARPLEAPRSLTRRLGLMMWTEVSQAPSCRSSWKAASRRKNWQDQAPQRSAFPLICWHPSGQRLRGWDPARVQPARLPALHPRPCVVSLRGVKPQRPARLWMPVASKEFPVTRWARPKTTRAGKVKASKLLCRMNQRSSGKHRGVAWEAEVFRWENSRPALLLLEAVPKARQGAS
mmetsp:Transcript_89563/g.214047  ORF Transcript_89563/g.214047 Transcript_89563/m.214047 type:complete len:231 (+) Transcript_89563:80-772(+)